MQFLSAADGPVAPTPATLVKVNRSSTFDLTAVVNRKFVASRVSAVADQWLNRPLNLFGQFSPVRPIVNNFFTLIKRLRMNK
jgi:hypothetical protein